MATVLAQGLCFEGGDCGNLVGIVVLVIIGLIAVVALIVGVATDTQRRGPDLVEEATTGSGHSTAQDPASSGEQTDGANGGTTPPGASSVSTSAERAKRPESEGSTRPDDSRFLVCPKCSSRRPRYVRHCSVCSVLNSGRATEASGMTDRAGLVGATDEEVEVADPVRVDRIT